MEKSKKKSNINHQSAHQWNSSRGCDGLCREDDQLADQIQSKASLDAAVSLEDKKKGITSW